MGENDQLQETCPEMSNSVEEGRRQEEGKSSLLPLQEAAEKGQAFASFPLNPR